MMGGGKGGWDLPGCAARFYHIPTIVFFTQSLPQAPFALYELACYSTHCVLVDYIMVYLGKLWCTWVYMGVQENYRF